VTVPLPMFPLGAVALPGSIVPLHIFELRYRQLARDLQRQGFLIVATSGTREFLEQNEVESGLAYKVHETERPNIVDRMINGEVTLVINTPTLAGNTARRLGSGWTFATVFRANSGQPLTPFIGSDRALNGFNAAGALPIPQRPNQLLDDVAAPNRGQDCLPGPCVAWVNPAAYALPAVNDFQVRVDKDFRITGSQRVRLSVDLFNIFNSDTTLTLRNNSSQVTPTTPWAQTLSIVRPRTVQFGIRYQF